jgi:hypothetical protein
VSEKVSASPPLSLCLSVSLSLALSRRVKESGVRYSHETNAERKDRGRPPSLKLNANILRCHFPGCHLSIEVAIFPLNSGVPVATCKKKNRGLCCSLERRKAQKKSSKCKGKERERQIKRQRALLRSVPSQPSTAERKGSIQYQ